MSTLVQDIRFALRTLAKTPGSTAVLILTLALGIGANTAIFSMVNGVLLKALPFEGGTHLVRVRQQAPKAGVDNMGFSVKDLADYRERTRSLTGMAEYHSMWFVLLGKNDAQRVQTGVVSASYFDVLGVKPILGRTFLPGEDAIGAEPVLILSNSFWRQKMGGDPAVIGRTFEMNDRVHTVVGVLPPIPQYPNENDVYMPASACPFRSNPRTLENRNGRIIAEVVARLKPGVTLQQAQSDVSTIAGQLQSEYPEAYPERNGYAVALVPLATVMTEGARPTFTVLLIIAGLVLLIACGNVANLTMARLMRREREIGIRTALGAGRGRILRQLLTESVVLSLAGGALGLLVAAGGLSLLIRFAQRLSPRANEITIDGSVLLFTLLLSLATGVLFGIAPLVPWGGRLSESLKDAGTRSTGGQAKRRLRGLLIVGQVALSLVLLVGAGLMVRSFLRLQSVDPGFQTEKVLTMSIDLNWSRYSSREERLAFFRRLLDDLRVLPGVRSAGLGGTYPFAGGSPASVPFQIEGRAQGPGDPTPVTDFRIGDPGYFRALGVPLVRGRDFLETDRFDRPLVAIASSATAKKYWGDRDPLGARISFDNGQTWRTIVGVAADVREYGLDQEPVAALYFSAYQVPPLSAAVVLRTAGDPQPLAQAAREAVKRIDPRQPITQVRTLDEARADSLASPRLTTMLIGIFAALAVVVAATGLGGVIAFLVSQSTREIGIRMALGAGSREVLLMVVGHGVRLAAAGIVLGLLGALLGTRLMRGLLFGVTATDPLTFLAVPLLLLGVALFASWLPARRATSVDPVVALRAE